MNVPPTHFVRVSAEVLRSFMESCLKASGLASDQAELIAELLTNADLRGVHSHGVGRMPGYCRALLDGQINPRPRVRVVQEEATSVVVDGDGGLGYLPTFRATELAIVRAKATGLGAGAVRHIGHYGAAGHYTRMCAEAGCIGFSVQGSAQTQFPDRPIAFFGAPPMSFAIPAGAEPPVVLDCSTLFFREGDLDLFERIPGVFFLHGRRVRPSRSTERPI